MTPRECCWVNKDLLGGTPRYEIAGMYEPGQVGKGVESFSWSVESKLKFFLTHPDREPKDKKNN